MLTSGLGELTHILQIAISPVAVISGVGLLVLSLTNRFARTTDKARELNKELKSKPSGEESDNISVQIDILYKRSKVLLIAINLSLTSVFFVGLLIIALFAIYLFKLNLNFLIVICFSFSVITLIISLGLFIKDMSLSLKALKLEIHKS